MKNLLLFGFILLGFMCPSFANEKTELPSETGIVENILNNKCFLF